jgi:branched-chain amino acid transport system permease protein
MDLLIINLLNGVCFSVILFLFAMGLSITLGTMGILNLTHGALFMLGGFFGLMVAKSGGNFWLAAIAGGIIAGIIGFVMELVFIRRLYKQLDDQVLLTLGLVYIIENLALWFFGGTARVVQPPAMLDFTVAIGNYTFPAYRLVIIVVGVVAFLVLWWLIDKTRVGAIVRAGMDNKEMTTSLGVNYGLTCSIVFTIGAFAGGFAGLIATPVIGVVFDESMSILLYAMIVVVVGGPGSVLGTLVGALIIGLVDTFITSYLRIYSLNMFTVYIVLIIMLLVKPAGIMGKKIWGED